MYVKCHHVRKTIRSCLLFTVSIFTCLNMHLVKIFRVETQDGGDARIEVSPRDIVYTQSANPLEGEQPEILHKLDLRYGYVFPSSLCYLFWSLF